MSHSKNEGAKDWDSYKDAQKERRLERLPIRTAQVESLRDLGYKVEKKTEYQFRINDVLDLYLIHNRYHDIKRNKRGGYPDAIEFVKRFFDAAKK